MWVDNTSDGRDQWHQSSAIRAILDKSDAQKISSIGTKLSALNLLYRRKEDGG